MKDAAAPVAHVSSLISSRTSAKLQDGYLLTLTSIGEAAL
jgi:hypothetical protein